MELNKVKKYKRQEKLFSILLMTFCIASGILISLVLLGVMTFPLFTYFGFGTIALTAIASIYIVPVLAVIWIILILMYISKLLRYKKGKGFMVFRTVFSIIILALMLVGVLILFSKYGIKLDIIILASNILLLALAIISLVFFYDNISKQYKSMINSEIGKEENISEEIVQKEIVASGRKKIIMASIVLAAIIVVFILIVAISDAIKDKKKKERKKELEEFFSSYSVPEEEETSKDFEYFANESEGILIHMGTPWRDRCLITIKKTEDGGKNWEEIQTNLSEVYEGSTFMFISKNVGFVHDIHGGYDSFANLKRTDDGGYTWKDVKVNKPDVITEKNIFFNGLPTENGDKLELIAYTFDLGRDPEYKYFKFESDDLGETWNFVEEVEKNDLE